MLFSLQLLSEKKMKVKRSGVNRDLLNAYPQLLAPVTLASNRSEFTKLFKKYDKWCVNVCVLCLLIAVVLVVLKMFVSK